MALYLTLFHQPPPHHEARRRISQDLLFADRPEVVVPDRHVRVLLAQDLLTNDDGLLGQLLSLVKLAL